MHPLLAAMMEADLLHRKAAMLWSATRETLLISINIYTHGAKDNFFSNISFISYSKCYRNSIPTKIQSEN